MRRYGIFIAVLMGLFLSTPSNADHRSDSLTTIEISDQLSVIRKSQKQTEHVLRGSVGVAFAGSIIMAMGIVSESPITVWIGAVTNVAGTVILITWTDITEVFTPDTKKKRRKKQASESSGYP